MDPRPYQVEAINRILASQGFLVADDCGLGKTLTAIVAGKRLRGLEAAWRGLVVCPTKIAAQWEQAIHDLEDSSIEVLRTQHLPYDVSLVKRGWVIVTYPELVLARSSHILKSVCSVLWDYLVVDEAHRLRNRKTLQTSNIKMISAIKRVALTATPKDKRFDDLWSILNFLRPDEFPHYWSFVRKWLNIERDWMEHWLPGDPLDPQKFGFMLSQYMIRRTKDEVLPELPERIDIPMRVEMTPQQAGAYEQLRKGKDILVQVEDKELLIKNTLTHILRCQQMSTDPALLDFYMPSGKLQWLSEFLQDHPHEPVVVFARFRETAEHLATLYGGDMIIGGNAGTGRDFIEGRKNLIVGTLDAMAEGVDGLQRADHAIFLDSHWSSIKMTQALDRIHRMNITSPKNIYLLYSCREDELVLKALEEKWSEAELVYFYLRAD